MRPGLACSLVQTILKYSMNIETKYRSFNILQQHCTMNRKLLIFEIEHLLLVWAGFISSWHELINVKLSGDPANAEKDDAVKFVPRFRGIVKAGGNAEHSMFIFDQISIFWKVY